MTILSLRSRPTLFRLRESLLEIVWTVLRNNAGRVLLRSLQDSRSRAAARVFRDYAHLISESGNIAREPSAPQ
jgi:hypothetical protein